MSKKPPKLTEGYKANYETLLEAAGNSDLALVSAIRKSDQQPVALLCAINYDEDEEMFYPAPLAVMVEGNPFELFEDPTIVEEEGDQECQEDVTSAPSSP